MFGPSLILGFLLAGAGPVRADDAAPGVRPAAVSPADMREGAADAIREMAEASSKLNAERQQVQKKGDTEAEQCISLQLAKIDALLQVSKDAEAAMIQALQDGLQQRADHEYRKIQIAVGKVRQFLADGYSCADADSAARKDQTVVTTEWAEAQVTDETDPPPDTDGEIGTDPPGTTPYE